jgi:hypothetical protein
LKLIVVGLTKIRLDGGLDCRSGWFSGLKLGEQALRWDVVGSYDNPKREIVKGLAAQRDGILDGNLERTIRRSVHRGKQPVFAVAEMRLEVGFGCGFQLLQRLDML